MKTTITSGVFLALNVVCATTNIILAPQTFSMGFALGTIAGLGHNIYLRTQLKEGMDEACVLKKVKKLNPFPGPFSTFIAYVAMKVNEYGMFNYLPFYTISLFAGVPLGYSAGKMLGLMPFGANVDYKMALAKISY
jgi:hypothetical protein